MAGTTGLARPSFWAATPPGRVEPGPLACNASGVALLSPNSVVLSRDQVNEEPTRKDRQKGTNHQDAWNRKRTLENIMASHPPGVIPSITQQGSPHYIGPKYPPPAPQKAPVPSMPVLPFIPPWTPPPTPPINLNIEAPPVHAAPAQFPDPLDASDAPRTLQSWVLDFAGGVGLFGFVMGTYESSGSLWQIAIWTLGFATLGAWAGVLRWGMERVFTVVSDALDAVLDACVKPPGRFASGLAAAVFALGYFLR